MVVVGREHEGNGRGEMSSEIKSTSIAHNSYVLTACFCTIVGTYLTLPTSNINHEPDGFVAGENQPSVRGPRFHRRIHSSPRSPFRSRLRIGWEAATDLSLDKSFCQMQFSAASIFHHLCPQKVPFFLSPLVILGVARVSNSE